MQKKTRKKRKKKGEEEVATKSPRAYPSTVGAFKHGHVGHGLQNPLGRLGLKCIAGTVGTKEVMPVSGGRQSMWPLAERTAFQQMFIGWGLETFW